VLLLRVQCITDEQKNETTTQSEESAATENGHSPWWRFPRISF